MVNRRRHRISEEITEELRFHLEGVMEELVARGWTRAEARAEALRRFGDPGRIGAECVDIDTEYDGRRRRLAVFRNAFQDVRYGLRSLRRTPSFAAMAILTLALGIGAAAAIFTVVNGVLLRPLPFDEPERLYLIWERNVQQRIEQDRPSPPNFADWRAGTRAFAGMTAIRDGSMTLTGVDRPEVLEGAAVTADFFRVLGVSPFLGRGFAEGEDTGGGARVVVLSHGAWQRLYGSDASVLGWTMHLDGVPYEIIGVMDARFDVPRSSIAIWLPFDPTGEGRQSRYLTVLARLRDDVTPAQAEAELQSVHARLAEQYPEANAGYVPYLVNAHDEVVGNARSILLIVFAAVGFVFLLACTNVASLVMSRATLREGEMAVRSALGATGRRLRAQLVAENLVLGVLGGALGVSLAYWGVRLFVGTAAAAVPRGDELGVDLRVLAFVLVTSLIAGIVLAVVPGMRAAGIARTLSEGGLRAIGGRRRESARRALIVVEVALSLILLVGAGLAIRSLQALRSLDTGFTSENVIASRVNLSGPRYDSGSLEDRNAVKTQHFEALLERVREIRGVTHAGMTSTLPLTQAGIDFDLPFLAEGQPVVPEEQAMQVDYRIVSAGYLDAMGIELVNGRDFSAIDRAGSRPVVLVNEAFANEHWPGRSAIGRTVTLFYVQNRTWEVVGVVADTRHRGLSAPPRSQVFVPLAQAEVLFGYMTLVVRTAGEVPGLTDAMRDAATSIDPSEPLYEFDTIETLLADATMRDRVAALVFGAFAAIAIVLAAAGIYGVISYQVAARTREIGVRLALGSSRGRVLGSVVGEAAVLSATGIAVGLGIAIAAARTAGGFLHGISANDPATLAGVSALLLGVSLMAAFVPARRAASVPPVEALRTD